MAKRKIYSDKERDAALDRKRLVEVWCAVSGASPAAHRPPTLGVLTGWPAYVRTGDPDDPGVTKGGAPGRPHCNLRRQLRQVLNYALVKNIVGDLARDVVATDVFALVWADVLARVGPAPR